MDEFREILGRSAFGQREIFMCVCVYVCALVSHVNCGVSCDTIKLIIN